MKTIYVRFVREHGMLSRFIQWFTWSKWSHVDIYIPATSTAAAVCVGSRLKGGVARRPEYYLDHSLAGLGYRGVSVTEAQYDACMAWIDQQVGKKYDWAAVLGFLVRHDWSTPDRFICSEFVMAAFQAIGISLLATTADDDYRISPSLLALSPVLKPYVMPVTWPMVKWPKGPKTNSSIDYSSMAG